LRGHFLNIIFKRAEYEKKSQTAVRQAATRLRPPPKTLAPTFAHGPQTVRPRRSWRNGVAGIVLRTEAVSKAFSLAFQRWKQQVISGNAGLFFHYLFQIISTVCFVVLFLSHWLLILMDTHIVLVIRSISTPYQSEEIALRTSVC
jgi:hypothetical protein